MGSLVGRYAKEPFAAAQYFPRRRADAQPAPNRCIIRGLKKCCQSSLKLFAVPILHLDPRQLKIVGPRLKATCDGRTRAVETGVSNDRGRLGRAGAVRIG